MADEQGRTFEAVHERLEQIVDEVAAEDITLDDALKLYEEAVKLGLSACDLSEQDVDAFLASGHGDDSPEEGGAAEEAHVASDAEHSGGSFGAETGGPAETTEAG